ncbi:MAG: GPR endopeptidase [Clostridia bacterium]|nr:GPR endopeptidase [Clostridia bacterium]
MDRIYRPLQHESGAIEGERYSQQDFSFHNGLISLKRGYLKGDGEDSLYFTYEIKDSLFCHEELKEALSELVTGSLGELLKKHKYKKGDKVLVVGLGNDKMTADALGAITVDGLQITRHLIEDKAARFTKYANISAIKSSVSGVTGLSSYDIITGVIEKTSPDFVIVVDTLACKSLSRLGRAVQLSDDGIEPGSGVNNTKTKLSKQSLGMPMIALGVPLVIYVKDIIREYVEQNRNVNINSDSLLYSLVVAEKEIDVTVVDFAGVLSQSINTALNRF